jgi:hypothetical protein
MPKWLMVTGLAILLVGAALHFFPGLFSWFGKLPGDIRSESENGVIFIPITSMILISILLSILLSIFRH